MERSSAQRAVLRKLHFLNLPHRLSPQPQCQLRRQLRPLQLRLLLNPSRRRWLLPFPPLWSLLRHPSLSLRQLRRSPRLFQCNPWLPLP